MTEDHLPHHLVVRLHVITTLQWVHIQARPFLNLRHKAPRINLSESSIPIMLARALLSYPQHHQV